MMDDEKTRTFFDFRTDQFVTLEARFIRKRVFHRRHETRYALQGLVTDGIRLTKFVDKPTWDSFVECW